MLCPYTNLHYGFLQTAAVNWSLSILTQPSTGVESNCCFHSFSEQIEILHFSHILSSIPTPSPPFQFPLPSSPHFNNSYIMTGFQVCPNPKETPYSAVYIFRRTQQDQKHGAHSTLVNIYMRLGEKTCSDVIVNPLKNLLGQGGAFSLQGFHLLRATCWSGTGEEPIMWMSP